MTTARCQEPGCTGTILDGYCDVCGSPAATVPAPSAGPAGSGRPPAPTTPGAPSAAASPGPTNQTTGACAEPGCDGRIVDGYCDVCGTPGAPDPAPGSAQAAPAARAGSGIPDPQASTTPPGGASPAQEEPLTPAARQQQLPTPKTADGTPCDQPGCAGSMLDGYCDTCGASGDDEPDSATSPLAPTQSRASNRLSSTAIGSARARQSGSKATRRLGTGSQRMRSARLGAGLTTIPPIPAIDASEAVMKQPVVPEAKRFCSNCGTKVGRTQGDRPGRTTGFCPKCRQQFSFDPKLKAGDLVAGQYEVAGCLAHGGLGWIYLARDRNVSNRWVVLKGLLNAGDPDALAAAIAEQRFLAQVEHPNFVEIYNFVTHDGAGYIVLEYVGGTSLTALLKQRMRKAGRYDAIPVDQALAYVIEILPAFQYLHDLGLAYCDFKPDNMIQVGDDIKLIDLGGVRRIDDDDSAIFGTVGYQAPEVAEQGVSVASDIYTIGRTLVVLTTEFRGYQSTYVDSLPAPEDTPAFAHYDSFYRLLLKACAKSPDDRFASADELRVQMLGVLREVVAQDRAEAAGASAGGSGASVGAAATAATTSAPSLLFEDPAIATDTLDWYTLPGLRPDPHDPQAGLLREVRVLKPHERDTALRGADPQSPEVLIELARTALDRGDPGMVDALTNQLLADDPWEWRAVWVQGLRALAARDSASAQSAFNAVYGQVPGELAPKLALAFACEVSREPAVAEALYAACARTDANYTPAGAFGMARIRAARQDPEGAVAALDLVPATSRAYALARERRAQLLVRPGAPLTELAEAVRSVETVSLEPETKAQLMVTVFEQALASVTGTVTSGAVTSGTSAAGSTAGKAVSKGGKRQAGQPGVSIAGHPGTERGIREGLEQAYRRLAQLSTDQQTRNELVDRANAVRPWTLR